jgi:Core-2/I-Branching enzyme
MPKIGYVILAHQNPSQLARLLQRIEQDSNMLFVHIDRGADLGQFLTCKGLVGIKNLIFLKKRYNSYWGSIGLVNATMEGIQAAITHNCDHIILLSGSDYPIKSNKEIQAFLAANNGKSFVNYYTMPALHWQPNKEINRIKKYYFYINSKLFEYPNPPEVKSLPRKVLSLILSVFLKKEREFPRNITPYGGDQWFCITQAAGRKVLDFYFEHPEVMRFLKYCLIPDEIFIQTALLNSGDEYFITTIVNDPIVLINWKNRGIDPSPSLFEKADFNKLKASENLFARKFNHDIHPELADQIDSELLSK